MKFPPKHELDAMDEWRRRYSYIEWPLYDKDASENHIKEAQALLEAAKNGVPFVSVPRYYSATPHLIFRAGNPEVWQHDWHNWKTSLPNAGDEITEQDALSITEWVGVAPRIDRLLPFVREVPTRKTEILPMVSELTKFQAYMNTLYTMAALPPIWRKYALYPIAPEMQLSNLINFRNGLIREGVNQKIIRRMNVEIGRLAREYHRYWQTA